MHPEGLVNELGYLPYSNRLVDLLFELISRRCEHKSTVITTDRAFMRWHEAFPNAARVELIDRLMHPCEMVAIEGESYRLKEAKARFEQQPAFFRANPQEDYLGALFGCPRREKSDMPHREV